MLSEMFLIAVSLGAGFLFVVFLFSVLTFLFPGSFGYLLGDLFIVCLEFVRWLQEKGFSSQGADNA